MTGHKFKEYRLKKGWTQVKAAMHLDVSQPYLALLERGKRKVPEKLTRKAVRVYGVSPAALPTNPSPVRQVEDDKLARELAALGYPGFAYMKGGWKRNPVEVLLTALAKPNLEARQVEALPWVLLNYPDMDRNELVAHARSESLSNKLGFVVSLAKQVAEKLDPVDSPRPLWLSQLEKDLSASRLLAEGTLCQDSLSTREREWLRENRPKEAEYWNLLTKWKPEHLTYAAT